MHSRPGKLSILSRQLRVRTAATVAEAPAKWDLRTTPVSAANNVGSAPISAVKSQGSNPPNLGKWARPPPPPPPPPPASNVDSSSSKLSSSASEPARITRSKNEAGRVNPASSVSSYPSTVPSAGDRRLPRVSFSDRWGNVLATPRPTVSSSTSSAPFPQKRDSVSSPSSKFGLSPSPLSKLGKWARRDVPSPESKDSTSGPSNGALTMERDSAPHIHRLPVDSSTAAPVSDQEDPAEEPIATSFDVEENITRKRKKNEDRGSLLLRIGEDVSIPRHRRIHNTKTSTTKPKAKVPKSAQIIRVNPDIMIPSVVSVGNLARLLNVTLDRLERVMIKAGMSSEASYDHVLTSEYASLIAMEFNRNPIVNDEAAFDIYPPPPHPEPSTLPLRPPVVTIMGHVDHGKTTLLDTLRSTAVAKGEAGGITQHIGAFSVPVKSDGDGPRTITFLDTPGHAAFSAMRARGARVTDIVVLVVSADDGIMPQTREVLRLIEQDKLSVVVAINKIDKPGVDIESVQTALLAEGVQLETFGGDVPSVPVSGLTGQGLDQLLETISVMAEMQDLRAEHTGNIQGYILESNLRRGLGNVATVLLVRGCLNTGAHIICGTTYGKVRIMLDSNGRAIKQAYPGMAVTVTGWKTLPNAGDEVLQGSESETKKALANRLRKIELEATLADVEAINNQRLADREKTEEEENETASPPVEQDSGPKELKLVVKGDVSGSVEAVVDALQCIGNKDACVKVIASGVGDVTESDVMRAHAVGGGIVAFSVPIPRPVQVVASQNNITTITSDIIYTLVDQVRSQVIDLLPRIIETKVTGEATVLQLFDIQLRGKLTRKVAGCRVINGVMDKNKTIRIVRDKKHIHEGQLETFKHHRKDITEAGKGMECGINISGFSDIEVGDLLQVFDKIEKPGIL